MSLLPSEYVLPDNYPVYPTYWYLVDGKPQRSEIYGNVAELKRVTSAKEICRCDAIARELPLRW